ncbi:MAG TPA: Tim44 domain-containing protein [Acidobacteriota bacterium]|nr:Tim44 domain-containing protein [Acidobacteriota bacterium]
MIITRQKSFVPALTLLALVGLSQILLESFVDARAGGGRTAGSRGSRSYQAPSRPTQPAAPPREATPQQPQQPIPQALPPQPGGFMRSLGTAMLGGFLGSLLFSGVAHAGLGGSGIGLIEIMLLAGIGYLIFRLFRARAAATDYGSLAYEETREQTPSTPAYSNAPPVQESLPLNGIDYRSLTMMDRSFSPERFLKTAQDLFFKIQGAWNKQDSATLRALCGADLMKSWEEEIAQLKTRGQKNRMDNIALRESEITEVWTENGEDFITVRLFANLLDYTVDEKGVVINGSDSDSVEFEEFWTFTRPVGPNGWKLTAVQQA